MKKKHKNKDGAREKNIGYCCECAAYTNVKTVGGDKIYPHRPDLFGKKFYQCTACGNYTGRYLGEKIVLPTEYIRKCRRSAHAMLAPIWGDKSTKTRYYDHMSQMFGYTFHWGEMMSEENAEKALRETERFLAGIDMEKEAKEEE